MKRFFSLLLVLALVGTMLVLPAAAADIKILVDGVAVVFPDAQPFADENSRTMVPLRPIAEAMGAEVKWVQETQAAVFTKTWTFEDSPFHLDSDGDGKADCYAFRSTLAFPLNSSAIGISVETYDYDTTEVDITFAIAYMDTKLVSRDGRVFAPVRYIANAFGKDAAWDGATSTVSIDEPSKTGGGYRLIGDENGFYFFAFTTPNIAAMHPHSVILYTEDNMPKELSFTVMTKDEIIENGLSTDEELAGYLEAGQSFFALKGDETLIGDVKFLQLRIRVDVTRTDGGATYEVLAVSKLFER